jgi:signal transduction histidine kinase
VFGTIIMTPGSQQQARSPAFPLLRTVKAKLLIAFSLIVALSVAIGSIGWRGFSNTELALDTLLEQSLPDIGNAMELARRSSSVAAIAPFVGSIQVMNKLNAENEKLERQLTEFRSLVDVLEPANASDGKPIPGSMRDLAVRLDADLRDLVQNTRDGLSVRSDLLELRYAFKDSAGIEARLRETDPESGNSDSPLTAYRRLVEIVLSVGNSNSLATLSELEADYDRSAQKLEVDIQTLDLASRTDDLKTFVAMQSRVFDLRRKELSTRERTQYLLASIHALSTLLSNRVAAVVSRVTEQTQARSLETNDALERGKYRIVELTLISLLVGSFAGFYVLRNLAGNLQAVTAAMSRLAGGDRTTTVPAIERADELGSLARAFNIFKEQSFDREALASDLIEKSRTLEAAFANMTNGMSVFDTDGRLVAWNPQFVEINELDSASVRQGMYFRQIFDQLVAAGVAFRSDYEIGDPDDLLRRRRTDAITYEQSFPSGRLVELRSRPMDGGFATMYTDLTERRAMEERLREAQRMEAVGQLTSGMAHDFNNLLAAVSGNLQMLQDALHDRPDLAPRVLRGLEAAERGATLTQRLLAFSRQQALKPEITDVNVLVLGLLDLLNYDIGNGVAVETELDPALGEALVDQAQLENAILNLIFNSRDAMPNGGKIRICTSNVPAESAVASRRFVRVSVSDDGVGMTPEVVARVFEPFFTTKEKGQGSGLGLSMVYGFVRQSGGEVDVASRPNEGTTVSITLPRMGVGVQYRKRRPTASGDEMSTKRGKEHVLIVEDDRIVRETAVDMLSNLGYRTTVAGNLEQAKIELDTANIDLLFTDYILPDGKTGDDVVAYAQKVKPDIAILYTSGYPRDKLKQDMSLPSNVTLIAKPFQMHALASAVRQVLDARWGNRVYISRTARPKR